MPVPGFGVYVHWPFCLAKCPYCDFNSHVRHGGVDQKRFADALIAELKVFGERTPGREVESVFFGGGTPSLMSAESVAAILDAIAGIWTVARDAEITLEANPTSVEAGRFAGYRAAGVNRVSIGVQALDDGDLGALGRQHDADEALAALAMAKRHFDRFSFDLIYARPGQTLEGWRNELSRALSVSGGHLSLYQLTIEPGTPFAERHARGRLRVPDDDLAADFFEATQVLCSEAGMPAYEVSNHAAPGAQCRHNLIYWRYGEYVGAGPGAHGRIVEGAVRRALSVTRDPDSWLRAVAERGHGIEEDAALTREEQLDEAVVMGLRLTEGVDLERLRALGLPLLDVSRVRDLCELGLLELQFAAERIVPTPAGRLVLNRLAAELTSGA